MTPVYGNIRNVQIYSYINSLQFLELDSEKSFSICIKIIKKCKLKFSLAILKERRKALLYINNFCEINILSFYFKVNLLMITKNVNALTFYIFAKTIWISKKPSFMPVLILIIRIIQTNLYSIVTSIGI